VVLRIEWTEKARKDLREIRAYIAKDSKRYARIQVERIQDTAERTLRFPKIGRSVPEFPEEDWRELLAGNYRIVYRIDEARSRILVLAVVHGKRLLVRNLIDPPDKPN
jgi:addiction module RelE/StbE family toxin